MRTAAIVGIFLACCALPVRADDAPNPAPDPELVAALEQFFDSVSPEARVERGLHIARRWPKPDVVAAVLPVVRRWESDAPGGDILTWKRKTADGVPHTIYANIPEGYTPEREWPVLIWLHGGVSGTQDGQGIYGIRYLNVQSDEQDFILLSPSSQRGAEWWTPNGVALVRGALRDLARRWRVDADRVAVAGFSDGASACFHLLAHDPEPYACFLPLMPQPLVTRLRGGPTFAANLGSRPVFAVSGGKDTLYSSAQIKPLIDELRSAGCDLEWTDMPEAGHFVAEALPAMWDRMRAFWQAQPREALPRRIQWETAVPVREGRFGWIEIMEVSAQAPSAQGMEAAVLPDPAARPRLGIRLDQAHAGAGVKIEAVEEGTPAAAAGFRAGDVIVAVDGVALPARQAALLMLRLRLNALKERAGVFRIQRGDEELELQARPRLVKPSAVARPAALGYGLPSGRVEAKVTPDGFLVVRTRHVAAFRLHLSSDLVDLSKSVKVIVNGHLRYYGVPERSISYMLSEAVRGGPGAPVYQATVVLRP